MAFSHFPKLNMYYRGAGWRRRWRKELERRAAGLTVTLDAENFFKGPNPVYDPAGSMRFLVDRYRPALDFLDRKPVESILEVGCAQGLTAWLMSDVAKRVVGIDHSPGRIRVARHLFPEVEFVAGDIFAYLKERAPRFEVIIQCDGPITDPAAVMPYCRLYIDVGRPTWWSFAMKRRHLAYRCSVFGDGLRGISPAYPLYYFRRRWLQDWKSLITLHRRLRDIPI